MLWRLLIVTTALGCAACLPAVAADAVRTGNTAQLSFGSGWGPYETYRNESFRWIANDARLTVRGRGLVTIFIACEGGPSLGALAFPLRVLDARGRQVDHVECDGKDRTSRMFLPVSQSATYVLHVDSRAPAAKVGNRILNFRVFSLASDAAEPAASSDIVRGSNGVRLAGGWFPIERDGTSMFRWIDGTDARFTIASAHDAALPVRLVAESGPSAAGAAVAVSIRDGRGKIVLARDVRTATTFAFRAHLSSGANTFTVHTEPTKNAPVPHDARTLNLRVFSIEAGDGR